MRHIIDAIAAQGRNGDDQLLHVTKGEMSGLDALARRHFGRSLPRNPRTGLKEASLFRDWFGNDVGMALDVAAPVATAFIPGVGPVAAAAMGAGIGAANQGLGKGGTTESALMGGVMGGIGAYGGSGLAEGLAGGAAAAPTTGMTTTATPLSSALPAGAETIATAAPGEATMSIADAGNLLKPATTTGLQAPSTAMSNVAPTIQGSTAAGAEPVASATTNTGAGLQATAPNGAPVTNLGGETGGTNWDYLKTKDALGPVTQIGTSALGTSQMPSGDQTTSTSITPVNKTLPKSEVYITPYGERRTRIAAAEGGLMGLDGYYGDYDGAEDGQGIRRYDFGGIVKSLQPGGAWGDATANLYGAVDQSAPWLKDITPGGAIGQLQPGRRDWEEKKRQEEEAKANEIKAKEAAAAKAAKDAAFQQQWQNRYSQNFAEGGSTGEGVPMLPSWVPDSSKTIVGKDGIKIPADATLQDREYLKALMALKNPGVYVPRRRIGMNEGGIASMAQGRYLQGAGDGMSDSIPASIDGKQEARLATGEFVVPADVVSHLGNGDSSAGAKQLHSMMDRARMARTGTKKQGKQINPRKVMPV